MGADFDRFAMARGQQLLLHGRYRHDSLMRVPKMQPRLLRLHRPRLEQKDARDDLQAVCNTMLHLLQQRFLLLQQLSDLTFGGTPIGDIFKCQENEIAGVSLIEYLPRTQEHQTPSDNGKVSFDFVSLHHGMLWRDVLQQQPKFGNPTGHRPARIPDDLEYPDDSS